MSTANKLYVVVGAPRGSETRQQTLDALRYINRRLGELTQMGARVRVVRVRADALGDPALVAALENRGIDRFPAMVTPGGVFNGNHAIISAYDRGIASYNGGGDGGASIRGRGSGRGRSSRDPEEMLRAYQSGEMAQGQMDDDDDDEMGDVGDKRQMESRMREFGEKRAASRGGAGGGLPPSARPSNVAAPGDSDDDFGDSESYGYGGGDSDGEDLLADYYAGEMHD